MSEAGELLVSRAPEDSVIMLLPLHNLAFLDCGISSTLHLEKHFYFLDPPDHLLHTIREFLPKQLQIEAVILDFDANSLIVVVAETATRCYNSFVFPPREDFEMAMNIRALRKLHPRFHSLVLTIRPRDAVAQGFVDSRRSAFDYVLRCFVCNGEEDTLSGRILITSKFMAVFAHSSLVPLWSKVVRKDRMRGEIS